jgi:hypothetical protein
MNKQLLREIQMTRAVEDPCYYKFEKRIKNCLIKSNEGPFIAFYKGSYADNEIERMYWKKVEYQFLEKKDKRGRELAWFEFLGKHIKLENYNMN